MMEHKDLYQFRIDCLALLEQVGATEEQQRHFSVLLEAFDVYGARNAKHGSLWKKFGWRDSIVSVRGKAARCVRQWWGSNPTGATGQAADVDDALDLINFAVFLINNVRDGNEWGDE